MTVAEIRAQIAELQSTIASMEQAESRRDGRSAGTHADDVAVLARSIEKLREDLIGVATWADLVDDAERDAYLVAFLFRRAGNSPSAASGRKYLQERLLLARNAERIQDYSRKASRDRESWMTKARGFEAERDMLRAQLIDAGMSPTA